MQCYHPSRTNFSQVLAKFAGVAEVMQNFLRYSQGLKRKSLSTHKRVLDLLIGLGYLLQKEHVILENVATTGNCSTRSPIDKRNQVSTSTRIIIAVQIKIKNTRLLTICSNGWETTSFTNRHVGPLCQWTCKPNDGIISAKPTKMAAAQRQ